MPGRANEEDLRRLRQGIRRSAILEKSYLLIKMLPREKRENAPWEVQLVGGGSPEAVKARGGWTLFPREKVRVWNVEGA